MTAPHQTTEPTGNRRETTGAARPRSSVQPLMTREDRQRLATIAASDLVDLLPPQDMPHPEKFMAGLIKTLSGYHQDVIAAAPVEIAKRVDRLTLKAVSEVCNALQEPVSRQIERDRALALPAPAKPDQERRDEQVADWDKRIKPLLGASLNRMSAEPEPTEHQS